MSQSLDQLRVCTRVQSEAIACLEAYQAALEGRSRTDSAAGGYANGYTAELNYLYFRKNAVDALILAMERLRAVSGPVRRFLANRQRISPHARTHRARQKP